jgi:ferredoxin-thioredoxin reductase catalytic subunit
MSEEITAEEIDALYQRMKSDAQSSGYFLNPDIPFVKSLLKGILTNQKRYGYWACPCRLASKRKEEDLDIICPCDYRDPDLAQYGCCYCSLYVSKDVAEGRRKAMPIPERRPPRSERSKPNAKTTPTPSALPLPVWRCKVCGYLCARDEPPDLCPICKAKKERFERFI